ncbi:hypothetical protein NMK71_04985 [Weeksellaceae bacterium KMM 9713]|uniref:Uncharacterized protein n=1 Tax=Profundicola chukchiensis TaxID=2961959 RepID=A0A9X4N033_9FLAO|nr:hypothetical protein [Profundicola chukchiensis]MDG4945761.1 hypothetical protein [Profundicola chukchiensis]
MNDFFADVYELWGLNYLGDFSEDLYTLDFYAPLFGISFGVVVVFLLVYYKLMDQPRFSKTLYWFIFLLIVSLLSFFIAYTRADAAIYNLYSNMGQDIPHGENAYLTFALTNLILFSIIYFILSLFFKLISVNHKYIPF